MTESLGGNLMNLRQAAAAKLNDIRRRRHELQCTIRATDHAAWRELLRLRREEVVAEQELRNAVRSKKGGGAA